MKTLNRLVQQAKGDLEQLFNFNSKALGAVPIHSRRCQSRATVFARPFRFMGDGALFSNPENQTERKTKPWKKQSRSIT